MRMPDECLYVVNTYVMMKSAEKAVQSKMEDRTTL